MKHLYLLLLFAGFTIHAQTYTWQWAKQGGGTQGWWDSTVSPLGDEMIRDVVVDSQNNSYYLSAVYPGNPNLYGNPLTSYSPYDLVIFSLDCTGNFRWATTLGGHGGSEQAWKLALDNDGGLYMFFNAFNTVDTSYPPNYEPIHFDPNHFIPKIQLTYPYGNATDPGFKTGYLLKYNTNDGMLVWSKPLQGDIEFLQNFMDTGIWTMDSSHNIHAVIGFLKGTHLNGMITVPNTYEYNQTAGVANGFQYYLVKFNYDSATGDMVLQPNPVLLPISANFTFAGHWGRVHLLYDELLHRYYFAGSTSGGFMDYGPVSYNGIPFSNDGFIMSFDPAGSELWRREFTTYVQNIPTATPAEKIFSLINDAAGSIYISGYYYNGGSLSDPAPTLSGTSAGGGTYSHTLPDGLYGAAVNYVMKLNPAGEVQWTKIPTSTQNMFAGTNSSYARIALNDNEIAFAKGSRGQENWDSFPINNPTNDLKNSLLVRLNKDTGSTIAVHPVSNGYGSDDELTSVAVDNDGNYILGGYFSTTLFNDPNDNIPTMTTPSYESDFYVAKLAKSACSTVATAETSAPEAEILFYPNPVNDMLKIETREKLDSYEVMTADGRMVSKGGFKGTDYSISMQQLMPGTYFIRVKGENISRTSKVIKK